MTSDRALSDAATVRACSGVADGHLWPASAAHVHDDDGCAGCLACAEPERYDDHTCVE